MKSTLFLLACAGLCVCLPLATAQDISGASGKTEIEVLAPDGKPLANAPVELRWPFTGREPDGAQILKTQTDLHGIVEFECTFGTQRFSVSAPGVGYGQTGDCEIEKNTIAHATTAPLVPYGTIEGTVPKELWEAGSRVAVEHYDSFGKLKARAANVDAERHFEISDLRAGNHFLQLRNSAGKSVSQRTVFVLPGQRIPVGLLHGNFNWDRPAASALRPAAAVQPKPVELPRITSFSGTVRDESGRSIAGATVFAADVYGPFIDPHRRAFVVQSTSSAADGTWRIEPPQGTAAFSGDGILVVHQAGHPVGTVRTDAIGTRNFHPTQMLGPQTGCDLRLPSAGASLKITVVTGAKPLQNAKVHVIRAYDGVIVDNSTPAGEQLRTILNPQARTDNNGVARFEQLRPGCYTIAVAAEGVKTDPRDLVNPGFSPRPPEQGRYAIYRELTLDPRGRRELRLSVYRHQFESRVQFLKRDGQPAIGTAAAVGYSYAGRPEPMQPRLEDQGRATIRLAEPCLFEAVFRYWTVHNRFAPVKGGHYFQAMVTLGSSARLKNFVTTLTAQFHKSGSFTVQLQDADGRPAHGYVIVGRNVFSGGMAGTTDSEGRVRFENSVALDWDNPYQVEGFIANSKVPSVGFDDEPLPRDRALTGHALPYRQVFKLFERDDNQVTLRAKPVGYVRGVVRPPRGLTCADFLVEGNIQPTQAATHYNRQTGEFSFGPAPEGEIYVSCVRADRSSTMDQRPVQIRSDRVAQIEFDGNRPPSPAARVPVNRQPSTEEVRGKVWMAGEKAPAAGALMSTAAAWSVFQPHSMYFRKFCSWSNAFWPGSYHPFAAGPGGEFKYTLVLHSGVPPYAPIDQTLIACLPGVCGAVALPITERNIHQDVSLVLPPPIKVRGTLTLAGKPIAGQDGQYVVLAYYTGNPVLQGAANVATNVGDDGRFELAGLTPGQYEVQAALDGIWLSGSVPLEVKNEAGELAPLRLDIGEPGVPCIVKCLGADGKPKIDVRASVRRPGPLPKFMPGEFVSDGAGVIHLPPLEAGSHQLCVDGVPHDLVLRVPAITGPNITPAELTVTIE